MKNTPKWLYPLIVSLSALCVVTMIVIMVFGGRKEHGIAVFSNKFTSPTEFTVEITQETAEELLSEIMPEGTRDVSVKFGDGTIRVSADLLTENAIKLLLTGDKSVPKLALLLLPERAALSASSSVEVVEGKLKLDIGTVGIGGIDISGSLLPDTWLQKANDNLNRAISEKNITVKYVTVTEGKMSVTVSVEK